MPDDNQSLTLSENIGKVHLQFIKSPQSDIDAIDTELNARIYTSWKGSLRVNPLEAHAGEKSGQQLRPPQISALFAILANLSNHKMETGTVVMPTGTGKTETMLAAICAYPMRKTLIIVPTDSLRKQTTDKAATLGLLRSLNAISDDAMNPIVATINGCIQSQEELDLALAANIIISTPFSINVNEPFVRQIIDNCTHLIIDEAHHVKAARWAEITKLFCDKHVLQFTATPFREDSQKIDGRIIYNYPVSLAQKNGYFRKITFKSVYEVNEMDGDQRVAEVAIAQLRLDLKKGYNHILMARCGTKKRAEEIIEIYKKACPDFDPILIHSSTKNKNATLKRIASKSHKVIVCVDMLGEGFDLPELKVCALHDIRKGLAITLQFAGRFVRDKKSLGNPTFVANICDKNVESALNELYKDQPDWNKVLQITSEKEVNKEIDLQLLEDSSNISGLEVPVANLRPAQSAIVYRYKKVDLARALDEMPLDPNELIVTAITNASNNFVAIITKVEEKTKWAPQSDFIQPEWRLIIVYASEKEKMLFIHDSSNSGTRRQIANYFDPDARLLLGDDTFKCFGRVERLSLQNAGLNRGKKGALRYVMYTGIDIEQAINDLAQNGSFKSNLFGKGYSNGEKVTIGCSYKGRIWSMNSSSINGWQKWCDELGNILNDSTISSNNILEKVQRTRELKSFPELTPIAIDWPDVFYGRNALACSIEVGGIKYDLENIAIDISSFDKDCINFVISESRFSATFKYQLTKGSAVISKVSGDNITLALKKYSGRIEEFFTNELTPTIYYEDGTRLFFNLHIVRPEGFILPLYKKDKLLSWNWKANIMNESQGLTKDQSSIQYQVLEYLKASTNKYWFIFDDDGANEISDIVSIKNENTHLLVEFYHLKFSSDEKPGARVTDLYEVCGQVIKGCRWIGEFDALIDRIKHREKLRLRSNGVSRIEEGEYKLLDQIKQHASRVRKEYKFYVVQPGISKAMITDNMLSILGNTNLYVKEITGVELGVICSQ